MKKYSPTLAVRLFILVACWMLSAFTCYAQTAPQHTGIVPQSIVYPNECGYRNREMITLLRRAKPKRALIVISHLGVGERRNTGERRLFNATTFLTNAVFDERWDSRFIVTAEGARVADGGYVDFFLDAELTLRIQLEKDADLYLGDCGAGVRLCDSPLDKQLHPCKARRFSLVDQPPNPKYRHHPKPK
jgi:hypothetical protein